MVRKLARFFAIIAILIGAVFAYGYWQVRSNGYFNISLSDRAGRTATRLSGDVERAEIALRDAARAVIAEGYVEPPWAFIRWRYPGHAECERTESAAMQTSDGYARWRQCIATFRRWYREAGDAARFFDVRWGACSVASVPLQMRINRDGWMVWWVPLPHVGGTPYTTYSAYIMLDSRDCSARVER